MGEIRATISITHYPQGVDHLIHSFKVMCNLMKVVSLLDIDKKKVSHVYFMKYSMMGPLQMPNIMSSNRSGPCL